MALVDQTPDSHPTGEFLDLFLPGKTAAVTKLKTDILRLNEPKNLKLIRSVLILGESGAGKSYIAKLIAMHRCWIEENFGAREGVALDHKEVLDRKRFYLRNRAETILKDSGEPYHAVNLTTLEGNLATALLFGHAKGTFTGAIGKKGIFGEERIKDVLLDEIGYSSIEMQRRLLEVVQSGKFYRVGATKLSETKARLLFATNQDLQRLLTKKEFQEDLWWRLTDYVISVPPLRERSEEIVPLAQAMVSDLNRKFSAAGGRVDLKKADCEWAAGQPWKGNLRELDRAIRRWFTFGGARSLEEVWRELEPYTPKPISDAPVPIAIDRSAIASIFRLQLEQARSGKHQFESPDELLQQVIASPAGDARKILAECLNEMDLSLEEMAAMFRCKPASVRSWRSRS